MGRTSVRPPVRPAFAGHVLPGLWFGSCFQLLTQRLRALTLLSAPKDRGSVNPHLVHKDIRQWVPALGAQSRHRPVPRTAASARPEGCGLILRTDEGPGFCPGRCCGPCGKRLLPRQEVCEVSFPAAAPHSRWKCVLWMVVKSSGQKSVPSTQTPSQEHLFHGPPRLLPSAHVTSPESRGRSHGGHGAWAFVQRRQRSRARGRGDGVMGQGGGVMESPSHVPGEARRGHQRRVPQ